MPINERNPWTGWRKWLGTAAILLIAGCLAAGFGYMFDGWARDMKESIRAEQHSRSC